jgi:hypothetical protein
MWRRYSSERVEMMFRIRRVFPTELTKCPLCVSSLRSIEAIRVTGNGFGKDRGKVVGHKLVVYGSGVRASQRYGRRSSLGNGIS